MTDLSRKRERDRLAGSAEPYWQRLSEGAYLGFRRGPDTWVARFRGRDKRQQYKALKDATDYDDAKRQAEAWCAQLAGTAVRTVKRDTVRAALDDYLADLRRHGRHDAAKDAESRFKRFVWNDPIASLTLEDAGREDFLEWRDRITKGREARTVNRNVRAVRAALTQAVENLGHVGTADAWRLQPLRDDVEEDGQTAIFLTPAQRRALIAAATPQAAEFFRGLELTGARPKELAGARVADFDGGTLKLSHRKGRSAKLRVRYHQCSEDAAAFLARQAKGKTPQAPLFTEDGSQAWRRHIWAREIRAAVGAHNEKARAKDRLPAGVGAYAFRHAFISERLQVHSIDPLTVAHQTGTSLAMIEKAYFKFIPSAMLAKLAAIKESA